MLDKNSKNNLMDIIVLELKKVIENEEFYNKLMNEIEGRINKNKLMKLLNSQIQIEYFDDLYELYFLDKALFKLRKNKELNPENFFTEDEILKLDNSPVVSGENNENENIIIIENVMQGADNRTWKCSFIHIKQIVENVFNGNVSYDWRIQRESRKVKRKNDYIERIWTSNKNIKQIEQKMLQEKFEPDEILWNVLDNGEAEEPIYDKENHRLIIKLNNETLIQLADGWHRTKASLSALSKNPDIEQYLELKICYYDLERIQDYIKQRGMATPMTTERIKSLNSGGEYSITKDMNELEPKTNLLCGKIGSVATDLKVGKLMLENPLAETIKKYFKFNPNNKIQIRKISNFLIELYGYYISNFESVFKENKEDIRFNCNIMTALIVIADKLYKTDNWFDIFIDFIDNYDWNRLENYTSVNISKGKRKELENILIEDFKRIKK